MKEGALKWGLRLLGIALLLGPIIAALAVNNWNPMAAVLPSESEISQIENSVTGLIGEGPSENTFSIVSITPVGNTVRVLIRFTSPLNIPIKIKDVSASVSDQGVDIAQVQMQEAEVEVPARATVNFTLVGTYTGGLPTNPQLSLGSITLECYGITVQAQISGGQGGS